MIRLFNTEAYSFNDERGAHTVQREYVDSPNGNSFGGAWVYRIEGEYIDHDTYRNDLAERNELYLGSLEF